MEQFIATMEKSSFPILSIGVSNKLECIATGTLAYYEDFYFLINACHSIPIGKNSPLYIVAPNKKPIEIPYAIPYSDIDIAITPICSKLLNYFIPLTANNLDDTFPHATYEKYTKRYVFFGFPVTRAKITDVITANPLPFITTESDESIYKSSNSNKLSHIVCDFKSKNVFYGKNPSKICTAPNLSGMSGGAIYRLFVDVGEKQDTPIISDFCGIAIEKNSSIYIKGVRKNIILEKLIKTIPQLASFS